MQCAISDPLMRLDDFSPLLDGVAVTDGPPDMRETGRGTELIWTLGAAWAGARFRLRIETCAVEPGREGLALAWRVEGLPVSRPLESFGLRIGRIGNLRAYLRNGYTSWDGSFYVEPEALRGYDVEPKMRTGYGMTQLLPRAGAGSLVIGFLRHDRFQHRLRFDLGPRPTALDVETLWDRVPHDGSAEGETLLLFSHDGVEEALRLWARNVAEASPVPARLSEDRITGWCSWYNLYAAIDETSIREHLEAARGAARRDGLALRVFQIDDGFTPEMGDWLEVKPQFPRGMAPLVAEIAEAGFTPGLWIAPFLVGNRSRLFRENPGWVVRERATGAPLAAMKFYGEFRWHKRSEEYYVLDVTHPEAEAYIRHVFRTWARDWGCRYFKTDFMYVGAEYGPDRAVWHEPGLSRIAVFMRMMRLIREEIGDAAWLGCGCPLLPSVGYVDGMRIGRDIGVTWDGEQSAESLLRDQATRNYTHGIFWQGDPDCILLRDRFHHLDNREVLALALFAGLAGGVAMTSDHLGEIPAERRALWRLLVGDGRVRRCDFPNLGKASIRYRPGRSYDRSPTLIAESDPVLVQRVLNTDPDDPTAAVLNIFNTGDSVVERRFTWAALGVVPPSRMAEPCGGSPVVADAAGFGVTLEPREAKLIALGGAMAPVPGKGA